MSTPGRLGLLLAPGAGANRDQPTLVAIDRSASAAGIEVVRMDFPYRKAGRRAPDRPKVLLEAVVSEAGELAGRCDRMVLGGRSMGGRMCSMAVAELFAASGRLASDPGDEQRSAAVLKWVHECQGPPLLGMDEVDWFRIMSRAKALAGAIEDGDDIDTVHSEATTLHDLLRSVV